MDNYSQYIMAAIEWGLVPIILVILFSYGVLIPPRDSTLTTSVIAGKLAGFIIFVLYVVSYKEHPIAFPFKLPTYGVDLLALVVGLTAGFICSRIANILLRTRVAGLVAMFLVSVSLITLYTHVLFSLFRPSIVFITLGGTLGVLLDILFFERDIVPAKKDDNTS
jgi:hypothetical protein